SAAATTGTPADCPAALATVAFAPGAERATRVLSVRDTGPSLTLWAERSSVLAAGEWQEPSRGIPRRRALAVILGTAGAIGLLASLGGVALRRPSHPAVSLQ